MDFLVGQNAGSGFLVVNNELSQADERVWMSVVLGRFDLWVHERVSRGSQK